MRAPRSIQATVAGMQNETKCPGLRLPGSRSFQAPASSSRGRPPRPGAPLARRPAAERARRVHLVHRGCSRLHRLPVLGELTASSDAAVAWPAAAATEVCMDGLDALASARTSRGLPRSDSRAKWWGRCPWVPRVVPVARSCLGSQWESRDPLFPDVSVIGKRGHRLGRWIHLGVRQRHQVARSAPGSRGR
jgi:hypothetical protein